MLSMAVSKFLLVAGLATGAYGWQAHTHAVAQREARLSSDSYGFMPAMMPAGTPPNTVVILAAQNCPGAAAQRADELARRLTSLGIPNIRTDSATFPLSPPDPGARQLMEHSELIGGGELPAVFFNGRGKSNPTLDEVTAEYRRDLSAS